MTGGGRRRANGWRTAALLAIVGVVTTMLGTAIVFVDAAQRVAALDRMKAVGRADVLAAAETGWFDSGTEIDRTIDDQFNSVLWLSYRSGTDVPRLAFTPLVFDSTTGEQLAFGADEVTAYLDEHAGDTREIQISYTWTPDSVPIATNFAWSGGWHFLPITAVFAAGLALAVIAAFSAAARWQDRARGEPAALAMLPSKAGSVKGEANV